MPRREVEREVDARVEVGVRAAVAPDAGGRGRRALGANIQRGRAALANPVTHLFLDGRGGIHQEQRSALPSQGADWLEQCGIAVEANLTDPIASHIHTHDTHLMVLP